MREDTLGPFWVNRPQLNPPYCRHSNFEIVRTQDGIGRNIHRKFCSDCKRLFDQCQQEEIDSVKGKTLRMVPQYPPETIVEGFKADLWRRMQKHPHAPEYLTLGYEKPDGGEYHLFCRQCNHTFNKQVPEVFIDHCTWDKEKGNFPHWFLENLWVNSVQHKIVNLWARPKALAAFKRRQQENNFDFPGESQ